MSLSYTLPKLAVPTLFKFIFIKQVSVTVEIIPQIYKMNFILNLANSPYHLLIPLILLKTVALVSIPRDKLFVFAFIFIYEFLVLTNDFCRPTVNCVIGSYGSNTDCLRRDFKGEIVKLFNTVVNLGS